MEKEYSIYLGSNKIGTTRLEKADAPMGVVFGEINFVEKESKAQQNLYTMPFGTLRIAKTLCVIREL